MHAAKLSGVDDFIKRHPAGYGLQISENGQNLSGGQRQSIGIARALLLDAPFLLLDEPTNTMDGTTELTLLKNLKQIELNTTFLLVTHKMSLLALVNRILVIEDGQLVADGEKNAVLKSLQQKTSSSAESES